MRRVTTLALAGTLLAPSVPAQTQQSVTEADFLASLGGDAHPAARALGEDLARAEAARLRAGTLFNPRLDYGREQPDANPVQDTWTLAWSPPLDGRLGLAKAAAAAGVDAARQRLAADRLRLRVELRRAFAEWFLSRERRDVLGRQHDAVSGLAGQAARRAEVGEESGMAAQRLRLAAAEVAAALALASAEGGRAEARVRAWRPDLAPDARPVRSPLPPLPAAISPVGRPDLAALRFEAQQAGLEARLAGRFVLFPELQGGWQRLDDRGSTRSGGVFGLSWSIPLFDRSQATRLEASRRREVAEARLALGDARARAELVAARAAYQTLVGSARAAAEEASGTERLLAGATAAFRAGEMTLTDLLETLRAIREARLRELDLYAAALEAHRNLETALGRPLTDGDAR